MRDYELEKNILSKLPFWDNYAVDSNFDFNLICLNEVTSTMDIARELYIKYMQKDKSSLLVLAKNQINGKGRNGNLWVTFPDSFAGTFVFKTSLDVQSISIIPLLTSLVISDALDPLIKKIKLKWPNDIVDFAGKKIGGIKIEIFYDKNLLQNIILIGIGINNFKITNYDETVVNNLMDKNIVDTISSLPNVDLILNLENLVVTLVPHIVSTFTNLNLKFLKQTREKWIKRALYLNEKIKFIQSEKETNGVFKNITEDGYILISDQEGRITEYTSGEIRKIVMC